MTVKCSSCITSCVLTTVPRRWRSAHCCRSTRPPLGKVLLAHHSYVAADLASKGTLPRFTSCTITDPRRLVAELAQVREQGWASSVQELINGEVSYAAPIHDRRGVVVGAIAISGRIERICDGSEPRTELVSYIREAARTISHDLGAVPW